LLAKEESRHHPQRRYRPRHRHRRHRRRRRSVPNQALCTRFSLFRPRRLLSRLTPLPAVPSVPAVVAVLSLPAVVVKRSRLEQA